MPKETSVNADGTAASEKKTAGKATAAKATAAKPAKKKTTKATATKAAKKKTTKATAAKAAKKTTTTAADAKKKTTKKTAADAADAKKKTTAEKAATKKAGNTLRVRQVRSGIRHPWRMRRTLTALGLKHHQDEVVVPDNPSVRGMLRRVHHLVSVTPEETNG